MPQVNVLDEIYRFIKEEMRPLVKGEQGRDILLKLKEMVDMFRSIEGRNFNDTLALNAERLDQYAKKVNVPYMNQEGRYSDCYVTFSMGGLHGAQYNKGKFEKLMKDKTLPRELYSIMRENTKLILTSASGAADVNYNSPIKMNNRIISMRIIGQALKGTQVISTNIDGLHTIMDEKINSEILEHEAQKIHVRIKPETVYLVSKDSNNRFEGIYHGYSGNSIQDITVTGAYGGQLSGMNGAGTTKSPDHPVIIDWALTEVLKWKALNGRMDEFSDEMGIKLIKEIALCRFPEKREYLRMFQHIISGSPEKNVYHFGTKVPYSLGNGSEVMPVAIPRCNRVFYVDPRKLPAEYRNQIIYLATAYIRPEKIDIEKMAVYVIKDLYHNKNAIIAGTPRIKIIKGIEYQTPCMIINESLDNTDLNPRWLNYEYYNFIIGKTYKKSWQNDCKLFDDSEDTNIW